MRQNLIQIVICLLPTIAIGQDNGIDILKMEKELLTYKRLNHADSLTIRGNVGEISEGLIDIANSLDKRKPVGYFLKAAEMFEKWKYNDASFLYHMGDLRYRYYNSINPKYSKSDDGVLLASFNYVLGEPIAYYLRVNVENFIEILKKCFDYQSTNDYQFYSKRRGLREYTEQADKLRKTIADIEEAWNKQRFDYERNIDSFLEQIKKK